MAEEREIKTVSFVLTSLDDPESVTAAFYDQSDQHFRLRLSHAQAIELGLKSLAAGTKSAGDMAIGLMVTGLEPGAFPDGGLSLAVEVASGETIRFLIEAEGAMAIRDALTNAIQGAVSVHPGGSTREH